MGVERVQLDHRWTAIAGVVAGDREPRQQVAEDAWHLLQLARRDGAAVHRAGRLPGQPLLYAGRAECMFTLGRLAIQTQHFLLLHKVHHRRLAIGR